MPNIPDLEIGTVAIGGALLRANGQSTMWLVLAYAGVADMGMCKTSLLKTRCIQVTTYLERLGKEPHCA